MNIMCSRCKKRVAVLFMTRMDGSNPVSEGLCLQCARELGFKQVDEIMNKMGLTDEDLENMDQQMLEALQGEDGEENPDFEMGGAMPLPLLQNLFGGDQVPAQQNEGSSSGEQATKEKKEKEQKTKKLKYLGAYCEDLTEKAAQGKIDRIIGRDREIYRVIQILNRRTKNNPCLIGEPGVGKTAIAEGIAQRLAAGDVPHALQGKRLFLLDLTALVAGTQFRGQFESRVKGLVEEIRREGNIILFIDEVHNLVGAGDAEGSMNAANILKPALSRGEIQVIGATTFKEYRKYIEKDAALERRFQPVTVEEPTIADTIEVIRGVKKYYEDFHRVKVPDEIVRNVAVLSERYITDRFLPDKAIDLLDEACSCATLKNKALSQFDQLNQNLRTLREEMEQMEQSGEGVDYEKLAMKKSDLLRLQEQIKSLEQEALNAQVTTEDVAQVIELWTGIPASKIKENELQRVAHLEEALKAKIIGQDEAVQLVAAAVRRSRVQLSPRRRPASFIFVGPTGVGKTELVKVLAHEMFRGEDPLIRLDMSEFMEKHAVSRIIGSPPGYVGYDEAGQLTEKVRRRPYSVVLFDEIEKAHPDVMNILLQILDEGRITDAQGRTVSFENTVIVMTSNAGSQLRESSLGFNQQLGSATKDRVMKALGEFLRPEFLGRVDEVVVFRSLDEGDFAEIAGLMLRELKDALEEKGISLQYNREVQQWIAHKAFGQQSGARDLRRVIRKEVEDPLCMLLVDQAQTPPTMIQLAVDQNALCMVTDTMLERLAGHKV